ncbi:MAG: gamma-glutamylcyclotransferase [Gammaproteobacteria bacterium]|nr:gamma-glutamylcyclotransferase [Gammaproteobacteria bacterium]
MPVERQRIYLAYGSNLHPRRLEARIGAVELLGVVTLPGWMMRFDKRGGDGSAKANLHAAPGSDRIARAAAYRVRSEQVGRLDVFEGCGRGYETMLMTIRVAGKERSAFTYLTPSQWVSRDLLPFDWYVDLIVGGARFHGFDQAYVREISQHDACEDPDHERARRELTEMNLPLRAHYKR